MELVILFGFIYWLVCFVRGDELKKMIHVINHHVPDRQNRQKQGNKMFKKILKSITGTLGKIRWRIIWMLLTKYNKVEVVS